MSNYTNANALVKTVDGNYTTMIDAYQNAIRVLCPHCGAICYVRRSKYNLLHLVLMNGEVHTDPACRFLSSRGIVYNCAALDLGFHSKMADKPPLTGGPEDPIDGEGNNTGTDTGHTTYPPSHNSPNDNLNLHHFSSLKDLYYAGFLTLPNHPLHDQTSLSDILINDLFAANYFDRFPHTKLGPRAIVAVAESCSPSTGWITFSLRLSTVPDKDRVIFFNLYDPFPNHITNLESQLFTSRNGIKEGKRVLIYGNWALWGCQNCRVMISPLPACAQMNCAHYCYYATITRKGQIAIL